VSRSDWCAPGGQRRAPSITRLSSPMSRTCHGRNLISMSPAAGGPIQGSSGQSTARATMSDDPAWLSYSCASVAIVPSNTTSTSGTRSLHAHALNGAGRHISNSPSREVCLGFATSSKDVVTSASSPIESGTTKRSRRLGMAGQQNPSAASSRAQRHDAQSEMSHIDRTYSPILSTRKYSGREAPEASGVRRISGSSPGAHSPMRRYAPQTERPGALSGCFSRPADQLPKRWIRFAVGVVVRLVVWVDTRREVRPFLDKHRS
jgi:hypothetical protein